MSKASLFILCSCLACSYLDPFGSHPAAGPGIRQVQYVGVETPIYVRVEEPTIIAFPGLIRSEFWQSPGLSKSKNGNQLILYPLPDLSVEGEGVKVSLEDGRFYRLWVLPASNEHPRDAAVTIIDNRSSSDVVRERRREWQ